MTAYDYVGRVWPHWATFQHYLPGGMHILHPDTDKGGLSDFNIKCFPLRESLRKAALLLTPLEGEHCISLAVSFSTHGDDFGGGEIKIYGCPPTAPWLSTVWPAFLAVTELSFVSWQTCQLLRDRSPRNLLAGHTNHGNHG